MISILAQFFLFPTDINLGRSRSGSRGKRTSGSSASGRSRSGSRNRNAGGINNPAASTEAAPPQDAFAAFLKAQGSSSGGRDSSVGSQGRRNSTGVGAAAAGAGAVERVGRGSAPELMSAHLRREEDDEQNTRDGSLGRLGGGSGGGGGGNNGPEPLHGLDDVHVGGKV